MNTAHLIQQNKTSLTLNEISNEDFVTTIIYYLTSFIVIILCLIFINSKL